MTNPTGSKSPHIDRRRFLSRMTVGGALVTGASFFGTAAALSPHGSGLRLDAPDFLAGERVRNAYEKRVDAAAAYALDPARPAQVDNGDERRYADLRASFFKTLPQNAYGEVEPAAFDELVTATAAGSVQAVEAIPASPLADRGLANPLAAHAYEMLGPDAWHTQMPPAPAFAGAVQAAEMAEVYWQALTRDVPFRDYATHRLVEVAVRDLNDFTHRPGGAGEVTAASLFRGEAPLVSVGPYISQLLCLSANWGLVKLEQRFVMPLAEQQFATTQPAWLRMQRGQAPDAATVFGAQPRYIANGRDLAEYVHRDVVYQAYLTAALVMLEMGTDALDPSNPYRSTHRQNGFVTFGVAEIVDLVAKAAVTALKAAWFQKWLVHRRLRPEVFAARAHFQATGLRDYDIHPELFDSLAADYLLDMNGSLFLPLAYPEGSPTHPSYPAGHAVVAGACATVLKALFNEQYVIPEPVQVSADGLRLDAWSGDALTLGGEIDKLAGNITLGRDAAGVHYRSDGIDGMALGEAIGLGILSDYAGTRAEQFGGFELTRFDGDVVHVGG